jgi:hypothetical protein
MTGPFGGVQSELPLDQIEQYGFLDSSNFIFRKGVATVRPGVTFLDPLPAPSNEPIMGIADFWNSAGVRKQTVITPTRLIEWDGSTPWIPITGTPLAGAPSQTFSWDAVGNKLCFSQGFDKVNIWDGISPGYVLADPAAPAAFFLAEIDLHLMAANLIIGGVAHTQSYMWSGAGDPTDWTSFNAGRNDNLNNLGPITGLKKLGTFGYGWHQRGIVQIQPTGIGVAPFFFSTIANSNVGNISFRTMDHFNQNGVECAIYVGKDNVYVFNQSSVIPVGDMPIDGRRRLGARSRIFSDLISGGPSTAYGFVTQSINGQIFNAYWLIIPGVRTWVYNFDEGNWTDLTYASGQTVAGLFFKQQGIRIMDLVGRISDQAWSPNTINPINPFDGFAMGFNDGKVAYIDFSNYSEIPASITSGKHIFQDRRHKHTLYNFRLTVQDNGPTTYTIAITNNTGQTLTKSIKLGTGSGDSISYLIPFTISGLRIQWTISVPAGQPGSVIEFALLHDISGEQRGGMVD